jgi:sugar phosphate isomerase/epimerase
MFDRRQFLLSLPAAALAAELALADEQDKSPLKFSLGLVTYNVAAAWDLDTLLKVCKATGVSPVELRTTHKHGVEPSLSKDARKEVKKKFADAGVAVWGCGTTCEFHSPDQNEVKKQIETCKRFVELCADIGGKGVKVRPNALPPLALRCPTPCRQWRSEVEAAKTLEQIGKSLIPCGKAAADAGVEIWVEVHGRGTAHPPYVKTMMEHCQHTRVGLTWNSNKEDIKEGSVKEYFELLKPWVRSCHINDLDSGYPYKELFALLRGVGYDRTTLCEYGKTYKDADEGIAFLKKYKQKWAELAKG